LFLFISSCIVFRPKTIGADGANVIANRLDSITNSNRVNDLSQTAIEGALKGSSSDVSTESIQQLAEILGQAIEKELNKTFSNLDTKPPGKKFSKAIVENLINKELEDKLSHLLSTSIQQADGDISLALAHMEESLNGTLSSVFGNLNMELSRMDEAIIQVMSEQLKDSLNLFINSSLNNIEFRTLSHKLSTELLSSELRDSLVSLVRDINNNIDITDPIPKFIVTLRNNAVWVAIIAAILVGLLMYWWYYLSKRSKIGDDLSQVINEIASESDPEIKAQVERFLKERGHYDFYKKNIEKGG
jgi:predicted negative regulator of RcsB-dependent stress response